MSQCASTDITTVAGGKKEIICPTKILLRFFCANQRKNFVNRYILYTFATHKLSMPYQAHNAPKHDAQCGECNRISMCEEVMR